MQNIFVGWIGKFFGGKMWSKISFLCVYIEHSLSYWEITSRQGVATVFKVFFPGLKSSTGLTRTVGLPWAKVVVAGGKESAVRGKINLTWWDGILDEKERGKNILLINCRGEKIFLPRLSSFVYINTNRFLFFLSSVCKPVFSSQQAAVSDYFQTSLLSTFGSNIFFSISHQFDFLLRSVLI